MPKEWTMPARDQQALAQIRRDIDVGLNLGILTAAEAGELAEQTRWATRNPFEWEALKAFNSAPGGFARLFESREKANRLPYLRSSCLKMLAHTNTPPGINWNYKVATAWKEALLDDYGRFVSGKRLRDLHEILSQTFIYIPKSGRGPVKEKSGQVGTVKLFTRDGFLWVFKPQSTTCTLQKGKDSGIPGTNAYMDNRSVASYLLAKALGVERIIVHTQFAYFQGPAQLEPGILMEGAMGQETQKMLPLMNELTRRTQDLTNETDIRSYFNALRERAHKVRGFTMDLFTHPAVVIDLFAANWLDYIAAQMDRHLNNILVHFSQPVQVGRPLCYEGIKLIDNETAFGTDSAPEKLMSIRESMNCGVPKCIPPGLDVRIRAIAQAIPDADRFWADARAGGPPAPGVRRPSGDVLAFNDFDEEAAPSAPAAPHAGHDLLGVGSTHNPPAAAGAPQHRQPLLRRGPVAGQGGSLDDLPLHFRPRTVIHDAVPVPAPAPAPAAVLPPDVPACMGDIARLISKAEFNGLMRRMNIAAQHAGMALPLNAGTVTMLVGEYTAVADMAASEANTPANTAKKIELGKKSYWHKILDLYEPHSDAPTEYDNPPKDAEEWIKRMKSNRRR